MTTTAAPAALETQISAKDGIATYCPEDNKLRLYVGRVPRDEYEALRAQGWTSTPKQDCDFVAVWTPERRDTCLKYADLIEDEDMSPEDRAADRAERFGEYRDKRLGEAIGHADRYDAGPRAHGFQSQARAERAAARHDRIATHACDAWSKAEYWQARTAGVIRHALHKSTPAVRMGRIKEIEAELRKAEKNLAEYRRRWQLWQEVAFQTGDVEKQNKMAELLAGSVHHWYDYQHPRAEKKASLYSLLTDHENPITGAEAAALYLNSHTDPESAEWEETRVMDWKRHYELRLAYENQMLEAQGGRAAFVEMEVGGWLGGRQIYKVNKSNATGRVVSVHVKGPKVQGWTYKAKNVPGTDYALYQIDTERLPENAYRPPTDEERAAFATEKKAAKAAAPKAETVPLINPTDEDAEKLQALWNSKARGGNPQTVLRITQAQYAANSKGTYARLSTVTISEHGTECSESTMGHKRYRAQVFKVRKGPSASDGLYSADRVVVLTDKPQKPLPWEAMEAARAAAPSVEKLTPKLPQIAEEIAKAWLDKADRALLDDAEYIGWVQIRSLSQFYWTDAGAKAWKEYQAQQEANPQPATTATQQELVLV